MSGTNINLPGVSLSASALAVASMQVTGLSTGVVHSDGSGNLSSSLVVNADVSASAAIAGTKISPDFGSQNVATTGSGSFGILALGSGTSIRDGANVLGTITANGTFWQLTTDSTMTNGLSLAATANTSGIYLNATGTSGFVKLAAPSILFQDVNAATAITLAPNATGATTQQLASTVTSYTFSQATHATVAHPMTIQAGNTTTGTGSSLTLTSGTGSVASGALALQAGGTTRIQVDNTGLGFYGHATTAQQVLATGAAHTVDDVITALQTLGLVKQA